jgi:sugar phosphate isomerase/epimerase
MRLGACAGTDALAALTQAGFEYVEPAVVTLLDPRSDEAAWQARKGAFLSAAGGLKAECFANLFPPDLKITGPSADREAVREYAAVAARRAVEVGGGIVVFGSGGARSTPRGTSRAQGQDQIVRFLTEVAPLMAAMGVTLALEPLRRQECNVLNTLAEARAMVARVNHPAVRLLADFWHVSQNGESMDEVAAAAGELAHVHLADPAERGAPEQVAPSLAEFLAALKHHGYDGRISVECRWCNLPEQAPRVAEALRRAWDDA